MGVGNDGDAAGIDVIPITESHSDVIQLGHIEEQVKAIKEGVKDKDGKVLMKPAENLSDDEIKALVAHMKSFKK